MLAKRILLAQMLYLGLSVIDVRLCSVTLCCILYLWKVVILVGVVHRGCVLMKPQCSILVGQSIGPSILQWLVGSLYFTYCLGTFMLWHKLQQPRFFAYDKCGHLSHFKYSVKALMIEHGRLSAWILCLYEWKSCL